MILPNEIIKTVLLYNSHPTADMIRTIIAKYQEVMIMRSKNSYCQPLSFYKTWCNIELDQVNIDKMKIQSLSCRVEKLDFDF
jgi:hypothetical protein